MFYSRCPMKKKKGCGGRSQWVYRKRRGKPESMRGKKVVGRRKKKKVVERGRKGHTLNSEGSENGEKNTATEGGGPEKYG